MLRFASHRKLTPAEVPDDDFDALRPHVTPQQMVELTSAIAWGDYWARFNRAFAVEAACTPGTPRQRAESGGQADKTTSW